MWGRSNTTATAAAASDDKLPTGWTKKESKSHKGRFYYISPTGEVQWKPPASAAKKAKAARVKYNWVKEIEIEFGDGRLGVSVGRVKESENILYQEFQAEVDDLPKVNGKAGSAELYNWSVKPHKRLTIGMRITSIAGAPLAGFKYEEVVDKLKRASRPLKIRFADVEKGTVEDNPDAVQEDADEKKERKPSEYLKQKQEYTRVLVTGELYTEMWSIENKKLTRQLNVTQKKWELVSTEFDALNAQAVALRKEHDQLTLDKHKYAKMIKQLKLHEDQGVESPEVARANELARRNTSLTDDIGKMGSGNKRLRKDQEKLQASLETLESELAKLDKKDTTDEEDKNDDDIFFGIDPTTSPKEQLALLRKKMRFMDDELIKEQRKASSVQKEMEQLNRHLAKLSGGESESAPPSPTGSTASASSRSYDDRSSKDSTSSSSTARRKSGERSGSKPSSSRRSAENGASPTPTPRSSGDGASNGSSGDVTRGGELPTDQAGLESRLRDLERKKRGVLKTLSKAANTGDRTLARDCQKKRKAIKEEMRRVQEALDAIKGEGATEQAPVKAVEPAASGSSDAPRSRQQSRTASVHGNNRDNRAMSSRDTPQKKTVEKMPTLTGFLEKGPTEWSGKGLIRNMKTMRGARERWCVISSDGFFKYYKRRGDPVVRGEIDLSDTSFEVVCEDMRRGKEFVLCSSAQQSRFFAKNTAEMQNWVNALRGANEYVKANNQVEKIANKIAAHSNDRRNATSKSKSKSSSNSNSHGNGNSHGDSYSRGMPEDDEMYGRATLGF